MTGIIFIAKESRIGRLVRKIRVRLYNKYVAATCATAASPKDIKGMYCVAIRFMPFSNVNIISDVIAHETVHEILDSKMGADVNKGFDKIDGDIYTINYIGRLYQ